MTYRYLTGPEDPAFAGVLRIYRSSFPPQTREPDERLVQELRGEYRLPFRFLIACADEGDGLGGTGHGRPAPVNNPSPRGPQVALTVMPTGVGGEVRPAKSHEAEEPPLAFARFCKVEGNAPAYAFLIHIAVDESSRGKRTGTALLQTVIDEVAPLPLLVEIDREGPVREWYERQGFHPVSESYTQPALGAETGPVPFALFAHGNVQDRNAMVADFYRSVWEMEAGHPFVVEAMKGVPA